MKELVDGKETKPEHIDPYNYWVRKNKAANVILMQLVAPAISSLVASSDTAAQAWKSLEDKYDTKNVTSTFHTLNACLSLTKETNAATLRLPSSEYNSPESNKRLTLQPAPFLYTSVA